MAATDAIIHQILIMLVLIVTGIVCCKINLITEEVNKKLSLLVLYLVNPALIIMSYQIKFQPDYLEGLAVTFGISFASMVLSILLAKVAIRGQDSADGNMAIERFSVVYSNCGFMGIPLINGLIGTKGVFYLTSYLTAYNFLVWTHGIMSIKGERSFKHLTNIIRTPAIIATAIGLLFFIVRVRIPSVISSALGYLGDMNTPMAMLVAGAAIAQANLLKAFVKPRIYLVTVLKLIAVPAIAILVFLPFFSDRTILLTVMIAAACPVGTMGTLFALSCKKNAAYASELFAFTTVFSIATLPLMTFVFHLL
ncbi:MAG: AEC family transporter [Ethanoligenens sp.]